MKKMYASFFISACKCIPVKGFVLLLALSFHLIVLAQPAVPFSRTNWSGAEPAGWTNSGCTPRLTTFACSGSNATTFDDNGDWRMVQFTGTPSQLTFKLKGAGLSPGSPTMIIVEESDDGIIWNFNSAYGTDISANPINDCDDISVGIFTTTQFIRWTFQKDIGNIDLDDVRISTTPKFYRSVASGDWTGPSTWESSDDNAVFTPTSFPPSSNDISIDVLSGHTVTISGTDVSMQNTTINTGATLLLTTPSTYIIGGSGDNLFIESGAKLSLNFAGLTPPSGTGTIMIRSGGIVEANSASSGAALGAAYVSTTSKVTYEHGAIFDWRIGTATNLGSGGTYFKTTAPFFIPIYRISVTPGFPFGGGSNTVFQARLEANAPFNFTGSGSKTFRGGLSGTSIITQSQGRVILPSGSAVLDGTITLNVENLGLEFTAGATVPATADVKIVGPEDGTINKISGTLQVEGILDVAGMNVLNTGMSGVVINGTLKTANLSGFSGTSATVIDGFLSLGPNSTIEFNRADGLTQNFEARTDFRNIKFSGNGSRIPSSSFNPFGNVIITQNAIFDCTGRNIGDANTNLVMSGGKLKVSTTGPQPNMTGIYDLTGGTIEYNGSNVTTETIRSGVEYFNIEVTGTNVGNSSGNITLKSGGSFTVKNGGVFTINTDAIVGPVGVQTLTVEDGGSFRCGDADGFNETAAGTATSVRGNIENIILTPFSTVEYLRAGNQPITNAGGLQYGNIIISGSGNKTAPASTLSLKGNFNHVSGTFLHNNGNISFDGTSTQSYLSSLPGLAFYDITNNNTTALNITTHLKVINSLSFGSGAKLHLATNITLVSDAVKTARVGQLNGGANVTYGTGRFIVERYIPLHSKAWQLLATPLQPEQTVRAAWQEGNAPLGNTTPGFGTIIVGNSTANGFDIASTLPSMKTYDPVTAGWTGIANTTSLQISNPKGYMLFVRGDRSVQTFGGAPTATNLRITGRIYTPSTPPPVTNVPAGKFESVGNPYASAIDLTLLNRTGDVQDVYYVWDPKLTTGPGSIYGLGGYRTLTRNGATYDVTPPGGSYGATTKYIQSGQAFFVRSFSTAGTVTFDEADKSDNYSLVTRFPVPSGQRLYTSLHAIVAGEPVLVDGVHAQFSPAYRNEADANDAYKLNNTGENISILTSQQHMAVERRGMLKKTDTIFYSLGQLRQQEYQLAFEPQNMITNLTAYLVDQFTNTRTEISLTAPSVRSFTVTTDPGSAAANRFYVVFTSKAQDNVEIMTGAGIVSVYPNPVTDGTLNLQFRGMKKGNYTIVIINSIGQPVWKKRSYLNNDSEINTYYLGRNLNPGSYRLVVIDNEGKEVSQQLIIN